MNERENTPSEELYDPAQDPDADPEEMTPIAQRPSQAEGDDDGELPGADQPSRS